MVGHVGQFGLQGVKDPLELGVHGVGVGLVVDAVEQRLTQPQLDFGVTSIRFFA